MRKVKLVLGLGIVLGVVGGTFLAAFGVLYVKPYMDIRTMKLAKCVTVTHDVVENRNVHCTCEGSDACVSKYPCLQMWVNVTSQLNHQVYVNITLYDSHETYILHREKLQCSYHKCNRDVQINVDAVNLFLDEYGKSGTEYDCHYDPMDISYAIVDVVSKYTIIHCMLWPSLALVVGFIILLVYLNDPSQAQHHFNSLERPWLRQQARYECINSPDGKANAAAITDNSGTGTIAQEQAQAQATQPPHLSHSSSTPVAQLI